MEAKNPDIISWIISAIAGIGGSGITVMVCRWFFNKFTSDFSKLVDKVTVISEQMAVAIVHIKKIAEHETIIKEHEKKFAYLEGHNNKARNTRPPRQ